MKRIVTLLLALTVLVCLTACGGDATTPGTTNSQPGTSSTATEPSSSINETVYNYKVRVVDQDGNPIASALVMFCSDSNCNFYYTNEEGWALIDAEIADGYKAMIGEGGLPSEYAGYTYSGEYTYFESGQTEMILVATKPAA